MYIDIFKEVYQYSFFMEKRSVELTIYITNSKQFLFIKKMNKTELTKIVCDKVDDKFIVLFLRFRNIRKSVLDLRASRQTTYKITNPRIKNQVLEHFSEFKQSKLDLHEFFQLNIVYACQSKRDSSQFNLRQTTFDETREVRVFVELFSLMLTFDVNIHVNINPC